MVLVCNVGSILNYLKVMHMAKSSSNPSITLFVLVLVGAAVLLVGQLRSRASVPLPRPLPDVDVQGWMNVEQAPTTADLSGKWLVVDLWATWCGPCIDSLPRIAEFRARWPNVQVIGIADDGVEAMSRLKQIVEGVPGFNWPVAYGGSQAFAALEADAIPKLVLFDPSGRIAWEGHRLEELERVLAGQLAN